LLKLFKRFLKATRGWVLVSVVIVLSPQKQQDPPKRQELFSNRNDAIHLKTEVLIKLLLSQYTVNLLSSQQLSASQNNAIPYG
jgi:hypothetical protein